MITVNMRTMGPLAGFLLKMIQVVARSPESRKPTKGRAEREGRDYGTTRFRSRVKKARDTQTRDSDSDSDSEMIHGDVTIDHRGEDDHIHHWRVGHGSHSGVAIEMKLAVYSSILRCLGTYGTESSDDVSGGIIEEGVIVVSGGFPRVGVPIGSVERSHFTSTRAHSAHI